MAKTVSGPRTAKVALQRERRKNRRLRALLDDLKQQLEINQRNVELQFTRLSQLQAEVDLLKASSDRSTPRLAPRPFRSSGAEN
jgi:uncharacterized protein YigA (DUF484 family)